MKRKLEKIIHPQVGSIERKKWTECELQRQRSKAICYDVPLLIRDEGGKALVMM